MEDKIVEAAQASLGEKKQTEPKTFTLIRLPTQRPVPIKGVRNRTLEGKQVQKQSTPPPQNQDALWRDMMKPNEERILQIDPM